MYEINIRRMSGRGEINAENEEIGGRGQVREMGKGVRRGRGGKMEIGINR